MKNPLILMLLGVGLIIGLSLFLVANKRTELGLINNNQSPLIKNTESPTQAIKNETGVPLPQGIDIVRSFFQIIGEHKPSEAVMMMNPDITNNDSVRQAWGVQLNAFEKLELKEVESSGQDSWTESKQMFKVIVNAKMKAEAINAPIPNYGWENGMNTKWIEIEKVNGNWFINGIASGP